MLAACAVDSCQGFLYGCIDPKSDTVTVDLTSFGRGLGLRDSEWDTGRDGYSARGPMPTVAEAALEAARQDASRRDPSRNPSDDAYLWEQGGPWGVQDELVRITDMSPPRCEVLDVPRRATSRTRSRDPDVAVPTPSRGRSNQSRDLDADFGCRPTSRNRSRSAMSRSASRNQDGGTPIPTPSSQRQRISESLANQKDALLGDCWNDPFHDEVPIIRALVQNIYEEHDPSKVDMVEQLFEKYSGLERELYERICDKCGVMPDPSFLPEPEDVEDEVGEEYAVYDDEAYGNATALEMQANAHRDDEYLTFFLASNGFAGVNTKRRRMLSSWYPLHVAVQQNDPVTVELLIFKGASLACRNSSGLTPLQLAQRRNQNGSHAQVLEILQHYTSNQWQSSTENHSHSQTRVSIFKRLTGRGGKKAKSERDQVSESFITQERSEIAER